MRLLPVSPRLLTLAIVLVAMVGCDRQAPAPDSATPAVPTVPDTAAVPISGTCVVDTSPVAARRWVVLNQDSLRVVLDTLDRRITGAAEPALPALLLQRGRARMPFHPDTRSRHANYAKARPDAFHYNEIGRNWLYRGADFHELMRRFPTSDLVDEAAYALTHLPSRGECEGSTACYIEREWMPVSTFLRAFPESPLADSAVTRALGVFRLLDSVPDLGAITDYYEPDAVRKLVASLDTVGRLLPPPRRTRVLEQVGRWWDGFGETEHARSAYQAALANASPQSRACLEPRLAALSAHSFTLAPTLAVHPRRVELRWQPASPAPNTYAVYRSSERAELGTEAARLTGNELAWTDTTTTSGTMYWYRVLAESPGDTVRSNPASATTPTLRMGVHGIAVSTTDQRLHVFGTLRNGFPQVLRISTDGASVERSDGMFIGVEQNDSPIQTHGVRIDDVWLVDGTGQGVLQFRAAGAELPPDLFYAVRGGSYLLRLTSEQRQGRRLLAALDEGARAAWLDWGGGGATTPIAMDCLAARSQCWSGGEFGVALRDSLRRKLATAAVPIELKSSSRGWVTAVYADPKDGSGWALMGGVGRLLHVDTLGAIKHDITLSEPNVTQLSMMSPDLDRRTIWLTWRRGKGGMELARIDVDAAEPKPTVVATDVPYVEQMAPDLTGGVWLLSREDIRRIDTAGLTLFAVRFNPD